MTREETRARTPRAAWITVPAAALLLAASPAAWAGDDHSDHDHGKHDDHAGHDHADHGHDDHGHDHDGHDHSGHHHVAPRGGTLVAVGDGSVSVEFLLDAETGNVSAWVMDGCAENPVRVEQKELVLKIHTGDGNADTTEEAVELRLAAVANVLTGETIGDTSEFRGQSDHLIGKERFRGELAGLTAKGHDFDAVTFPYAESAE